MTNLSIHKTALLIALKSLNTVQAEYKINTQIDPNILASRSNYNQPISRNRRQASSFLISNRKKRSNAGIFEEWGANDLERECYEEICNFEELSEALNHDFIQADRMWKRMVDLCTYGDENERCDYDNTSVCVNKFRNLACKCKTGWQGTYCKIDVNECQQQKYLNSCTNIDKNMECIDLPGSFKCECKAGYREDTNSHTRSCINIDECYEGIDGCQQNCHDRLGSFVCSCSKGYRLGSDGKSCYDVNECIDKNVMNMCNEHSTCENLKGDYARGDFGQSAVDRSYRVDSI